jgi:hypothetical protein
MDESSVAPILVNTVVGVPAATTFADAGVLACVSTTALGVGLIIALAQSSESKRLSHGLRVNEQSSALTVPLPVNITSEQARHA